MAINLLNIEPHKVSKDLSGYITYIYGAPKTGKTTLATQMPGALLLAFEAGYNALPGVANPQKVHLLVFQQPKTERVAHT